MLAFAGPMDCLIRRQSQPMDVVDAEWRERVEEHANALGTRCARLLQPLPYSAAAAARPIQPRNGATNALSGFFISSLTVKW